MLNKQGRGKIDWTDYTWNPISGCRHNCSYCYIKSMDDRFKSNIMEPAWHPERLKDIENKKLKSNDKIFVGSSGDMWGNWVDKGWIDEILEIADCYNQYIFQFLTKNPIKYSDYDFTGLDNCWFGTSEDGTWRTLENHKILSMHIPESLIKFVSFEPIISKPIISSFFYELNWIIIGADSNKGAEKPPKEWADFLISAARENNIPVFVKDNYGYPEAIKEFPKTTI